MEVRLLIEPRIASLAALRATAGDIGHMEKCLTKLDRAVEQRSGSQNGALYDHWDGTLHRAIAESTRNALLLTLFDSLNSVRNLSSWGRLQAAALNKKRWLLYCRQHRSVIEAITSRDPVEAERAMRQHLETVQKNLLDVAFSSVGGYDGPSAPPPRARHGVSNRPASAYRSSASAKGSP
jgi:DNA-binding FadR family transcriptional regulator